MKNKKRHIASMKYLGGNRFAAHLNFSKSFKSIAVAPEIESKITKLQAAPDPQLTLIPDQGDYIFPVFRSLSKTIIEGHWIDLTRGNVLKDSMPLMNGITVYPDHDWRVAGWLGSVVGVEWEDEADGIPAGINSTWKIDWKANTKIARGLVMQPPALHDSSVTFLFTMEKSHPDMDRWDFWMNLGREVDGQLVRMIVTEITDYWEDSLVFQGADVFAVSRGMRFFQKQMEELSRSETLSLSMPTAGAVVISPQPDPPALQLLENENQKDGESDMLKKEVLESLGIVEESPKPETIEEAITKLLTEKADLEKLKESSDIGKKYLNALRKRAINKISLVEGKAVNAAMLSTIQTAPLDFVISMLELYEPKAAQKLPIKCQSCGSTNVSRRSSIEEAPGASMNAVDVSKLADFKLAR